MKNKLVLAVVVIIVIMVIGFSVGANWRNLDHFGKTEHETDTWAVIKDLKGDIIAVEATDPSVWHTLVYLHNNQTEMWVGGIIEEYDNYWGFRFRPDTIVIAEITIEGAQSSIQAISGDLNYWINIWTKETYVLAKVIEIHE
jgi:hypothetical protein